MPNQSREEMHTEAEALLDRQDVAGARQLYMRICEFAPDDADAWLMLGLIDGDAGMNSEALSALRTALAHDPELAEAHFSIARLLATTGDLDKALRSCTAAVELDADYPEAWMLMGVIYGNKNKFKNAAACFQEILKRNPDSEEAAVNLGQALTSGGQISEAFGVYVRAVQQHPSSAALWVAMGNTCRALGKQSDAVYAFKRGAELAPGDPRGQMSLAELYLEQGLPAKSAATCRALLTANPGNIEALSIMGTTLQLQGNLVEAVACLGQAVDLQPGNADNNYKLACACQALGELDRSLIHFKRTLELEPGSARAIGGLVRAFDQKGDTEGVKQLLPKLIESADHAPEILPTLSSVATKFNVEKICMNKLRLAISNKNTSNDLRSRLHWASGMLNDRAGNFDAAFEHHQKSKTLMAARYDKDAHSTFVDRIIQTFNPEVLAASPAPSRQSELPVFIVGMPRSGTSLVEQILASHQQVFGAGELDTIGKIAYNLPRQLGSSNRYPDCVRELDTKSIDTAAKKYLAHLENLSPDSARITDKMPHNFLHLGLIQMLLPKARIIHVMRDPMDTCVSCFFQEFSHAHAYTCSLGGLGAHYKDYQRVMSHWKKVLRIRILDIRYEDLVTRPEAMMRTLTEFCGLPWDPACEEFYKSDRIVATLSASQVREPLNPRSIERWKKYESHLAPLKTALGL